MIMAFLKHGHLLRDLNKTYNINSKKGNSEKVNDHGPINLNYLINSYTKYYQLITHNIAKINISSGKRLFPECDIYDNILIAHPNS